MTLLPSFLSLICGEWLSRRLRCLCEAKPFFSSRICVEWLNLLLLVLLATPVMFEGRALADEPLSAAELDERSLSLRTALHNDPTLDSPLTSLADLYRKANRSDDLLGVYRLHLQDYPDDVSATIVLLRRRKSYQTTA